MYCILFLTRCQYKTQKIMAGREINLHRPYFLDSLDVIQSQPSNPAYHLPPKRSSGSFSQMRTNFSNCARASMKIFSVCCKIKMQKVADRKCRLLQSKNAGNCNCILQVIADPTVSPEREAPDRPVAPESDIK